MSEKNQAVFQDNDKRAKRAIIWQVIVPIISIVLVVLAVIAILVGGVSIYGLSSGAENGVASGVIVLIILGLLLLLVVAVIGISIAAIVFYLMWVHRAHQNAEAISGEKLFLSAGWNVGFHFIPLVNLIIPYLLMFQIAKKSSSEGAKNITLTWWILVLVANGGSLLINIFSFTSSFITSFDNSYNSSGSGYYFSPLGSSVGIFELLLGGVTNLLSLAAFIISFFVIHLVNKGQKEKALEMGLKLKED